MIWYCAIGEERWDVTESLKTFHIDKGRLIEIKPEPVEDKEPVAKSGPAAAKQNVGILVNGRNAHSTITPWRIVAILCMVMKYLHMSLRIVACEFTDPIVQMPNILWLIMDIVF